MRSNRGHARDGLLFLLLAAILGGCLDQDVAFVVGQACVPCSLIFLRISSTRSARSLSRRGNGRMTGLRNSIAFGSGRGRPDAVENRFEPPTARQ